MIETKKISLRKDTAEKIAKLGTLEDTYETVIRRILDFYMVHYPQLASTPITQLSSTPVTQLPGTPIIQLSSTSHMRVIKLESRIGMVCDNSVKAV